MPRQSPYQPSLLRLLHGSSALLVLGAAISGYWLYEEFDGRWGKIGLPEIDQLMQIHHGIGEVCTIVTFLLILYSLTLGRHRLIQLASLKHLTQLGRPAGANSWRQLGNTFIMGAVILALMSGKRMEGRWLANGDLEQLPYLIHLSAWGAIGLGFILHILTNLRIGGMQILMSVFSLRLRKNDMPKDWFGQIKKFFR